MPKRNLTAIPAARSSAKSLKRKQWLIIGAWIALASLGPLSFCTVMTRPELAPAAVGNTFPADYVGFAEVAAKDFLDGRPTALPATREVDPSFGFTNNTVGFEYRSMVLHSVYDASVPQGEGTRAITIVTFRVQTDSGDLYDLSVTLADDGRDHPVLAALPTIRRSVLAATDAAPPVNYSDAPGALDPSPQMLTAVQQWLEAYLADDRPQLKMLVNGATPDGDAPDGDYVGLGGYELAGTPTLVSVVPAAGGDVAYARVRFGLTAGADGFSAQNELDLLLSRYSSNDPRVVAWGAPGTGPVLEPFRNNTSFQ